LEETMPGARPLPKKFLANLEQTQEELRIIAQKSKVALAEVEAKRSPLLLAKSILQEIETTAYRLAYELAQLRVAQNCNGCPLAPPSTEAQMYLMVLAEQLEQQAEVARTRAQFRTTADGFTSGDALLD
jgi:hypothetical protein